MHRELVGVKVPELNKLTNIYTVVADAVAEAESVEELVEMFRTTVWRHLPINGRQLHYLLEHLPDLVESYEDDERKRTVLVGTPRVFHMVLTLAGYPAWRLGRAVAVAVEAEVEYVLRIRDKDGKVVEKPSTDPAVAIVVFGDPDSGRRDMDIVAITGYRFGVDAILLDANTLHQVHGDPLDEAETLVGELAMLVNMAMPWKVDSPEAKTDYLYAKGLINCLNSVVKFLRDVARRRRL